jgi:hypothetical protein
MGIVATTIQSTTAFRPMRAAASWLTSVEKELPINAAARHVGPASVCREVPTAIQHPFYPFVPATSETGNFPTRHTFMMHQ